MALSSLTAEAKDCTSIVARHASVVENSSVVEKNGVSVKVPSVIDDSILRYIEYQEWYAHMPDKIKHIKYLEDKFSHGEVVPNTLFDKLHYYVDLPLAKNDQHVTNGRRKRYLKYLVSLLEKLGESIKQRGLWKTATLVAKKIRK